MNIIVKSTDLTEESFRKSDKLREAARQFFESEAGAAVLYLMSQRAKVSAKSDVPVGDIRDHALAELFRLAGAQQQITLITNLCLPPVEPRQAPGIPQLGGHDEKNLPPKFELNKQEQTKS